MNPNPNCDQECRFTYGPTMSTCVYYEPVFDKYGNNLNPDMNSHTTTVRCSVCHRSWNLTTKGKTSTFQETS